MHGPEYIEEHRKSTIMSRKSAAIKDAIKIILDNFMSNGGDLGLYEDLKAGVMEEGNYMKRTKLMNILKYEIPKEFQNRNDVLVCHYCTSYLGSLAVILFVLGLFSGIGLTIMCLASDNMYVLEKLSLLVLSVGVGALGAAGGWLAVKYMKNWTVIFHEKGIWYRNLIGKIYNFTDEEVKWYTMTNGPKHYFITLGTDSKRIWINHYSSNYRQAKQLIQQKYQEWEH